VITHDLDFGAILAATKAVGPSVVQVRMQDVLSRRFEETLVATLQQFQEQLEDGALVSVDEAAARVHLLPLKD